jgi:hypothetical protein
LCSYTIVDLNRRGEQRSLHEISINARIHLSPRKRTLARTLLTVTAMSFAALVDRVRLDFVDMPKMKLTLPQAVRLWSLGMDDCRYVIDSLVDAGFLALTPQRTIVRRGRDPLGRQDTQRANISVLVTKAHNKSVRNS